MITDETFSEEVRSVSRTAFAVAYLILNHTSDSEDAVSDAILSAYEHRRSLRTTDSFRAWFLRIVRNEAYDILRNRKRTTPVDVFPDQPAPQCNRDTTLDLRSAIMQLPEQQRSALLLQQEGYTLEEIATILAIPVGTVKSRLFRAKETLRIILEDHIDA